MMFTLLIASLALGLGSAVPQTSTQVPFTTVVEGQGSSIDDPLEVTVRTGAEWKVLWQKHARDQKMPAVDFTKFTVVGVFMGERTTGGYRAIVSAITREGNDLVVTWHEEQPSPNLMVTQALTAPFHIVRIDRTSSAITFKKAPTTTSK
jgi:hypothetical protein